MVARVLVFALALLLMLAPRPARAHGMTSAYLEVTELPNGRAMVRVAAAVPLSSITVPTPDGCRDDGPEPTSTPDRTMVCEGGLEGRAITVSGLGPIVSDVVLRATFEDGTTASRILTAEEPSWTIPRASDRKSVV